MKRIIFPVAAVAVILALAAGAAFALTGGGDEDDTDAVAELSGDEKCAADAAGCADPNSDTPGGGSVAGMCVEGVPDCVDMIVNPDGGVADPDAPPGEPVSSDDPGSVPNSGDLVDPGECSLTHNIDACQEQAAALVTEDLAARTGAVPDLLSAEFVEWPDAGLGNPEPGMAYAEVITPGFKFILEAAGTQYEYHTDTAGNFTLLD